MRRVSLALSVCFFVLGSAALAATLYLWFGAWPRDMKAVVDHYRSIGERSTHDTDPLIGHPVGRRHTSLAGRWQAVIDPYERGELGGMAPRGVEPGTPSDLAEFSFENGLELDVPGDWNTQDPRLVFYQGVVWYKRDFEAQPIPRGERRFLHFGAANYAASVYLNGRMLGAHIGGFTPFVYEVTDHLRGGSNQLVVKVDSRLRPDDVPTPLTDWLNYGGLTRDVLLIQTPATFVRDWVVQLDGATGRNLVGWIELNGPDAALSRVGLRIDELGIDVELATDAAGRAEFAVDLSEIALERWSPEAPRLYDVTIESPNDRVVDRIGLRRIEVTEREIRLNDEPVFLRGISIHEEAGMGLGRVRGEADARRILTWAKELGCNFVRLSHYPHAEETVRLADEMGLLVWEEIPVYWSVDFENPRSLRVAQDQMAEIVARDRNRASVIFWSIGNETPDVPGRLEFMGAMADHVRTLDDTRLVTAALLPQQKAMARFFAGSYLPALMGLGAIGDWVFRVEDPLAEKIDVPALNEYFGWYYSGAVGALGLFTSHHARQVMLENLPRIRLEGPPDKPMILSEFGAGARLGLRRPEGELAAFSEEYQAKVYRAQIAMIREQEGLVGISPWILKDFRSPMRMYQGVQDYWNLKGLVADDGRHKLAWGVLHEFYAERERGGSPPVNSRSSI